ncbi:hypothetical protein THOM_0699 [Trachipleistophora hominis]|uniref:Uncharacterized protein n=1 Tax=Trachipleistophora hominis TaxID=72359 RepID=L7JXY2_TRAHO|nr:hypothetical protein THOM_0699 [Trachipleistophora hominis]
MDKMTYDITEEDIARFSTIEHEFSSVKEHFSNYKFALIERESKMLFLESIKDDVQVDYLPIFKESKKRLEETKEVGVALGEEIKALSMKNYELKRSISSIVVEYDALEELKKRFLESGNEFNKAEEINRLEREYNTASETAKGMVAELERLREEGEALEAERERSYVTHLRERVEELRRKRKRWSRVEYDRMLIDAYRWYDMMISVLEMFFGTLGEVVPRKNGFDLNVSVGGTEMVVMIRNGTFVGVGGIENEWASDIVRWCVRLESARLFVLLAKRQLRK